MSENNMSNDTYYCWDADGVYTHSEPAQPDHRSGGYLAPPDNATFDSIPAKPWPDNTWPRRVDDAWVLVPDYRGIRYWLPDGSEHRIELLGLTVPPEGLLERPVLLPEAKDAKLAEIERGRDAQATASVAVHGRTWQADERSQALLARASQLCGLTGYLPAHWRDEANDNMPLTDIGQLVAIATAIAQQTDTAYNVSWQRKAALDAAQTVEEVQSV